MRRTIDRLPALSIAAALLASIAPPSLGEIDPREVVDQIGEATIRHYLDDLLFAHNGDNRSIDGPDHDPARDNIVSTLRGFGLDPRLEPVRYAGRTYYNVVAVQEGLVTPDQQYIISGHYDSVGNPGADDDGSGCAAVMEIARVLTRYPFESTIIYIAFDVEEAGMIGSRAYVADHPDDDVRGMISMDMIGHGRGTGRADIYGHVESNPIKTALRDALITYNDGMTPRVFLELDRSDHAPFEWAGKQACLLIEAFGPDANPCYHQACDSVDNPDYIHYDYLTQLTRGVAGYLAEHAGLMELPLEFHYPTGLPERVLPGGGSRMRVVVSSGTEEPMPGTASLHYLVDETFEEMPLETVGTNAYDVVFPAVHCGDTLAYYISVETADGDVVTDPFPAPDRLHSADATLGRSPLFEDDFETDTGWTVTNENVTDGAWERAVPITGQSGAPPADFDGSGRCYVTGNERFEDIDGGPTHLTSPSFNLTGEQARVRYARWFLGGGTDFLDVAVSGDDGQTWQRVEHVGGDQNPWIQHEFSINEFVPPSETVRIRFSAADNPNNSYAEAALDALSINALVCGMGEVVRPDEVVVTRGAWRSGDVVELLGSDNAHLIVDARRPTEVGAASVEIEIAATAPTSDPTELVLVVESGCPADPVVQRLELFNFATMRWERFDERPAPSVDATTAVGLRGRAWEFVDPDTHEIRARIGYADRGVTFPAWHGAYDEIYWLIAP
jgi:hypothetical protein